VITSAPFEKNIYYPDQKIVVHFDCDSSKCDKPVKLFKLKLKRKLLLSYGHIHHGYETSSSSFLVVEKAEGCPTRSKV
jgi:hypothetical protein